MDSLKIFNDLLSDLEIKDINIRKKIKKKIKKEIVILIKVYYKCILKDSKYSNMLTSLEEYVQDKIKLNYFENILFKLILNQELVVKIIKNIISKKLK